MSLIIKTIKFDSSKDFCEDIDSFSIAHSSIITEIEDSAKLIPNKNSYLKIFHQNIRSITRNIDDFLIMLKRTSVDWDMLILTECWLKSTHYIPTIDGYNYYKNNSNLTQNEGVVVYYKTSQNVETESLKIDECNSIIIKINTDTVIIAIYRPPGFKNPNTFIQSLDQCLTQLCNYKNLILIGDINIDIMKDNTNSESMYYLNLLASHGLLPAHSLPTHTKTCLDHVILRTKQPAMCYVAETSITDHDSILFFMKNSLGCHNRSLSKVSKRINYIGLENDLNSIQFDDIYQFTDVNLATEFFLKTLNLAISNNTITKKTSNRKTINKPWLTMGLLRCLRNRDKLHQKSKKDPHNDILQITYKRYRNYCSEILKKLKMEYNKTELTKASKGNNKKLWNTIKSVTNTKKCNETASVLIKNTEPVTSINTINSFFVNIGKTLVEKINKDTLIVPNFPDKSHPHSLVLHKTDTEEIRSLIFGLKSNSSVGRDNIPAEFLKKFHTLMVPLLTYICNLAIETSKFPKQLKLADVLPIYKSGSRDRVDNYRPISILPTLSKIMEKVLNKRLCTYLENNKLLSSSQFGFRSKLSTNDAVQAVTNFIVTNLDNNEKVIVIFLDLAKAFDTVPATLLLNKLEKLGVRDKQLALFKDYLTDRYQRVKIDEYYSSDLPINYGVPQGSVLGPTLFLTYINSLCELKMVNGRIVTFADDTALLFHAKTWTEVFNFAQIGFNRVLQWLTVNRLTLNVNKTKYIPFSIKKQSSSDLNSFSIKAHYCNTTNNICSCPDLNKSDSIKYLGVVIDEHLNFNQHIDLLTSRLRKLIFVFKNLRHLANYKVIKIVYSSLCQSLMTYCITTWGGAPKTKMIQLERAQRAILKVSKSLPFIYPTNDLYRICEVLSVRRLFILQTVLEKHAKLQYDPNIEKKRRKNNVCPSVGYNTQFSHKFFCFLGGYLYNKLNKKLSFYSLSTRESKNLIKHYLLNLDYNTTENLLTVTS